MNNPVLLLDCMAEALNTLWAMDVTNCPFERTVADHLSHAEAAIRSGSFDPSDCEPETFGPDGFKTPEALVNWLKENLPPQDRAGTHGDFCLPNVLLKDGKVSGFIDCGDTAIGDKWKDIALCYRSLKHNFDGTFGGKVYPDFNPDLLFDVLGIEPDWDKIRYWILLDELF